MNRKETHLEKEHPSTFSELVKCAGAGACICLGAMVKSSVQNPILGAFLFSIGLLAVCMFKLNLYTGKVGYIDTYPTVTEYWKKMLACFIGNLTGVALIALLSEGPMVSGAESICQSIVRMGTFVVFLKSILCGIFIYIAVEGYKRCSRKIDGVLCLVLCVMGFILTGGRHCIADAAYMFISDRYPDFAMEGRILAAAMGNCVGALLARFITLLE